MNFRSLIVALALTGGVSAAQAATTTFTLTGPDLPGVVSFSLPSQVVGGGQGYPGGPDQLWGKTTISLIGGWANFFSDGKTLGFEATNLPTASFPYGNLVLEAANAFYSLSGTTPSTFVLNLPSFGTQNIKMTNTAWGTPDYGKVYDLKISAVPGPIAGAGLPALLGLMGFTAWHRRRQQAEA